MSLIIEDDEGEEIFALRCAPQCATDILVQVHHIEKEGVLFTFQIGELLREQLEDHGCLDGTLSMSIIEMDIFLRWANQLEAYAHLIRASLMPLQESSTTSPQPDGSADHSRSRGDEP